jgi:hypothetical protein
MLNPEKWRSLLDEANKLRAEAYAQSSSGLHTLADATMRELELAIMLSDLEDAKTWTAGTLDPELAQ